MKCEDCSDVFKVHRVTAYVLRFVRNLKKIYETQQWCDDDRSLKQGRVNSQRTYMSERDARFSESKREVHTAVYSVGSGHR